jgi:molecular chaperone GrpE
MKHVPPDIEKNQWVSGIRSIRQQLDGILKQIGVAEITTVNIPFDMHSHEAVLEVESDGPEGEIAQELQKGYSLHDKILRPAKVSVTKKKE